MVAEISFEEGIPYAMLGCMKMVGIPRQDSDQGHKSVSTERQLSWYQLLFFFLSLELGNGKRVRFWNE